MLKKILFCLLPICAFALEEQPWYGDVYQFHLLNKYSYSFYSKVEGAIPPLASTSHDHLLYFDLEYCPKTSWSIDTDLQFVDTPRQIFSFSTWAIQGRYLWLDDIIGDVFSLSTGLDFRYVSSRSLKDVSSPYHGNIEGEGNIALGKEFDPNDRLRLRFWGFGAIGIANRGSLWTKATLSLESLYKDKHKCALFFQGSHGYGEEQFVNIKHFRGYGYLRYYFVDLGLRYGLKLGVWGSVKAEYKRRLVAHLTPEGVNTFSFYYIFPFSF